MTTRHEVPNQREKPQLRSTASSARQPLNRLIMGGLLLVAPSLLAAKGCDVATIGSDKSSCGGLSGAACEDGEFCDYPSDASCGAADATGVCEKIPDACELIYAPVCGCDDKTYGNECEARSAGVSVAREGECESTPTDSCGGLSGAACEDGEFCNYPIDAMCGAADATGRCAAMPDVCELIYAPVCGCDDKTYGNECEARSAGVSVAREGECESTPTDSCGGLSGAACEDGEFCNYPIDAMCGAADATGRCEPQPEGCNDNYEPVCGCDDQTYGNACQAHSAGVSVAREGECESTPTDSCGGLLGLACGAGEFCNYPIDAMCGAADATGRCEAMPDACDLIYAPVCGCDDKTYGNECEAHSAGVSVAREGECESTPTDSCGGLSGAACEDGEFCNYPVDAMCGAADAMGTCEPQPEACDGNYDPVCGCDDQTYGNACQAHSAGVSVAREGECDAPPANTCGGLQGLACEAGEFCNYPIDAMCGAADAMGTCEPIPEVCAEIYSPVCGCDDQTYGNECEAHGAGVSVSATGECMN